MRIAIASDHAGFKLKESLKSFLKSLNFDVVDFGTDSENPVDYPDFGKLVGKAIENKSVEKGVLVCGSGIGMCIAANRFSRVRAAVIKDAFDAEMSREHNDTNVACFGTRTTGSDTTLKLLELWLNTKFEGGRHEKRIKKL